MNINKHINEHYSLKNLISLSKQPEGTSIIFKGPNQSEENTPPNT